MKTVIAALFIVASLHAFADEHKSAGKMPPKEAIEACKSQKADAACKFKGKGGKEVAGTCWDPESEKPLACKPANHAEGEGHATH